MGLPDQIAKSNKLAHGGFSSNPNEVCKPKQKIFKGLLLLIFMKKEERSSKTTDEKDLKLFIFEQIKKGIMPKQISQENSIKMNALQYYLSSLKQEGLIEKIGYGVWQINDEKEVQKSIHVANLNLLKPDSVRGHAFVFKFELPKNLRNWERREELLKSTGIEFKPLKIFGGGQQVIFRGRKVWLTDKSIIIYEPESFIADLARDSQSKALFHIIELMRGLERHLQANFNINQSRFRVTRQHYALVKNALAKQYDDEGKKLNCYTGEGLWFIIDNSFNLHEAETIHARTAVKDNEKVQNFFNGIKKFDNFTPEFVTESIGKVTENQMIFAENMKTHIKAIQDLADGVNELKRTIREMKQ